MVSTNTKLAEAARLLDDAIKDLPDGCEGWLEPLDERIAELRAALAAHDAEQEPCHDAWRAALAQRREPLQDSTLWGMWGDSPSDVLAFARRIERHYGIGATTGQEPGNG